MLVNAVYFKGLWDVPFRVELTHPKEFHLSNGQTKIVDTMRMRNVFKTGKDSNNNAEVIIMPFEVSEQCFGTFIEIKQFEEPHKVDRNCRNK